MEWKPMKPEKTVLPPLSGHSMISVESFQQENQEESSQNVIVIFGGRNQQNKLTNDSYLYDPGSHKTNSKLSSQQYFH
jgi:hypothetical protein